jgi:hypothetical protein
MTVEHGADLLDRAARKVLYALLDRNKNGGLG